MGEPTVTSLTMTCAVGGHVGYGVGPAFRAARVRHGNPAAVGGTPSAGRREWALVTCADGNAASAATIEACGGCWRTWSRTGTTAPPAATGSALDRRHTGTRPR
ncbi:hypothetical protein QJS66_12120 [Kocuria rhizophila]|nr:hypothetical protein QJS66_12120 [Kocuria rhizophila]